MGEPKAEAEGQSGDERMIACTSGAVPSSFPLRRTHKGEETFQFPLHRAVADRSGWEGRLGQRAQKLAYIPELWEGKGSKSIPPRSRCSARGLCLRGACSQFFRGRVVREWKRFILGNETDSVWKVGAPVVSVLSSETVMALFSKSVPSFGNEPFAVLFPFEEPRARVQ